MKKNTNFLMIYVAILFSFALVLILFAGLTQNNYEKKIAESQGMKENLVELTEVNSTLEESIKHLNGELDSTKKQNEENLQNIESLKSSIELTDTLVNALKLYESGKKDDARQTVSQIDVQTLTQSQLYIYHKIT